MKIKQHLLLIATTVIYSCTFTKPLDNAVMAAQGAGDVFIEMNDGKIIPGKDCKNHLWDRKPKNEISLDGHDYSVNDVIGFQTYHIYFRRTPYGYLTRVLKGNMNLYYRKEILNSKADVNIFFFDKPGQSAKQIGIQQLREAVTDNATALTLLNKYYPRSDYLSIRQYNLAKIMAVVNAYNH